MSHRRSQRSKSKALRVKHSAGLQAGWLPRLRKELRQERIKKAQEGVSPNG